MKSFEISSYINTKLQPACWTEAISSTTVWDIIGIWSA